MAKAATSVVLWLFFCTILSAHALTPDIKRPTWSDLTPAQQQVLGPLKPDWDKLDVVRRKKWVGVADRFPKMKLEEQKRLQQRMKDWAQLSPEQRRAAELGEQVVAVARDHVAGPGDVHHPRVGHEFEQLAGALLGEQVAHPAPHEQRRYPDTPGGVREAVRIDDRRAGLVVGTEFARDEGRVPVPVPAAVVALAKILKPKGVDVIDCSSGGMRGSPVVSAGPVTYGYQVPYAERLRREADIGQLTREQDRLLQALWPLLRPGGVMVYCTCSVFKIEGEKQVQAFVANNTDAVQKPAPGHLIPAVGVNGGAVGDNGSCEPDGFFYALLQKAV